MLRVPFTQICIHRLISFIPAGFLIFLLLSIFSPTAFTQDTIPAPSVNERLVLVPSSIPPYTSLNGLQTPQGLVIDLFNAIAERAGVRFEYQPMQDREQIRRALDGGIGDILLNIGNTLDVEQWLDFTSSVTDIPVSIFVRENASSVSSISDLKNRKVALVSSQQLTQKNLSLASLSQLNIVNYEQVELAFYALMSKQVDALIYLEPVVWNVAINLQLSDQVRTLSTPLSVIPFNIGVRKQQQLLLEKLEVATQSLNRSDQFQKVYHHWFKHDIPFWNTRTVFWSMSAVVVLILLITQWLRSRELQMVNESLQQQIDDATVQLSESNAYLMDLTVTDSLTGINNRRAFENSLSELILRSNRYNEVFCMLIFDIDDFKKLNDHFGHAAGDSVLIELVERVSSVVRDVDTLCRWGGEEFTILMPQTGQEGALKMAERCRSIVANNAFDEVGQVTISLGVTCYMPLDNERKLFKRADDALYEAKSQGKNCVVWNNSITGKI